MHSIQVPTIPPHRVKFLPSLDRTRDNAPGNEEDGLHLANASLHIPPSLRKRRSKSTHRPFILTRPQRSSRLSTTSTSRRLFAPPVSALGSMGPRLCSFFHTADFLRCLRKARRKRKARWSPHCQRKLRHLRQHRLRKVPQFSSSSKEKKTK